MKQKNDAASANVAGSFEKPFGLERHFLPYSSTDPSQDLTVSNNKENLPATPWTAGKVRGIVSSHTDEDPEENIAFSSTYISDRPQGVQINGANFTRLSIPPGKEHKFGVHDRYGLRMCSVASGSIHVALGKLRFDIVEGGMFRIKTKEYCVIENEGKQMAILHVFSIT
ncbi:hypothetical protein D0Z07_7375 [Hyphodiscus hymeniophilus]|uniref:Uncharacterized protein n=1 Tax=Hyphodiscus hymeniophilus TaxID=353542 RepID=A0A9P6VEV4_9HELO|nr:hypothetical protein D0Z07_7375 [Hyphodiscus hymeniophilus]